MDQNSSNRALPEQSLTTVLNEIFGRWPGWPWSVLGFIVGSGLIGLVIAWLVASSDPALGLAAVTGYGLAVGSFFTLIPRMLKLQQCSRDLRQWPSDEPDCWPYRLLGAALIDVPALRATPEEFGAAVDRTRGRARGILAARLWPATAAAFVVPVLGLISAWESGAMVTIKSSEQADIYAEFLPQIAPPMVATISIALVLMLVIVGIDQWTRVLLTGWAERVHFTDMEAPAVQTEPRPLHELDHEREVSGESTGMKPPPVPGAPPTVDPPTDRNASQEDISVDAFTDLLEKFGR